MKLTRRKVLDWSIRLRPGLGLAVLWVAALPILEILGRRSESDLFDLVAVIALIGLAAFTLRCHKRRRLAGMAWLISRLREMTARLKQLQVTKGIDFRRSPLLPAELPPLHARALFAGVIALHVLLFLAASMPSGLRSVLLPGSYVLYLAVVATLWTVLLAGLLLFTFVPLLLLNQSFVARLMGQPSAIGTRERVVALAWFGGLFLMALILPAWTPVLVSALALIAGVALLIRPGNPHLALVWLDAPRRELRRTELAWLLVTLLAEGALIVFCATLASRGEAIFGGIDTFRSPMVVTSTLGAAFAWTAGGAGLCLVVTLHRALTSFRSQDPTHPVRPVLHLEGGPLGSERRRLAAALQRIGWRLRSRDDAAEDGDLVVAWSQGEREVDREIAPLLRGDLADPAVALRLERRRNIYLRRRIVSAFERLFREARRGNYERGEGYWIDLHHWFVPGFRRDVEELPEREGLLPSPPSLIGPLYRDLLPRAARHHFYAVLRSLGVDLGFVEDGVDFRSFRRVLRRLFALADRPGTTRFAEEHDFTGLPGVRVVILEQDGTQGPLRGPFQDAEEEPLGRARILHVFRERGGSEETVTPPRVSHDRPLQLAGA